MQMPAKPAAKKPAAKKPVAKKKAPAVKKKAPAPKKAAAKAAAKRKAAPAPKKPAAKSAPKPAPKPAADPHAGHDMTTAPAPVADPHAGHDMAAPAAEAASGTDLPAGNAAPPPIPADHAADAIYGAPAMAVGRHHLDDHHGGQKLGQIMFNIAEYQARKGGDGFEWDAEGWYGGDIRRAIVKSEGEGTFGEPLERAEVQALYSHAIGPYFNLQGGLRYDFKPNPSRVYATIGVEGLAPSFFDVEGALFLSHKGELMARAEGYYDQRITQRLILQPRAELNFAAQNSRDIGVGAGLSDAEVGFRLRYDIAREFSPYLGVQYHRAFGKTRRYLKEEGENAAGWSLLAGVRAWF
jgi:copper resistance protein B